jgi:hypothetical protein
MIGKVYSIITKIRLNTWETWKYSCVYYVTLYYYQLATRYGHYEAVYINMRGKRKMWILLMCFKCEVTRSLYNSSDAKHFYYVKCNSYCKGSVGDTSEKEANISYNICILAFIMLLWRVCWWNVWAETCSLFVIVFCYVIIQSAYKLSEDFAKPYFYKYWIEINDVTSIWKTNVCSFIVTLNAFDVHPTRVEAPLNCYTAKIPGQTNYARSARQPFPSNTGLHFSREMAVTTIGPFQVLVHCV